MYAEDLEVPHSIYDLERVLDWEKRIANYSPSVQQKYRALIKKKDDLFRYLDEDKSNGWSVMINNKKKDLYAETRNSERGIPMIRARTYSNYDPLTTFRIVGSSDMRPKYDKNIHYCKMIDKLGTNLLVGYQRSHRIITVAPRDMYQEGLGNCEADGTIWIALHDADSTEYPVESGIVRMSTPIAGFRFTPYPDDPSKCTVEMLIECNIGGLIPNWIFKQVLGEMAYGLVNLRALLPDWYKKNKKQLAKDKLIEQQKHLEGKGKIYKN